MYKGGIVIVNDGSLVVSTDNLEILTLADDVLYASSIKLMTVQEVNDGSLMVEDG